MRIQEHYTPLQHYDEDLKYLKEKYYDNMFTNFWEWPDTKKIISQSN
jgi:hypothetical protein